MGYCHGVGYDPALDEGLAIARGLRSVPRATTAASSIASAPIAAAVVDGDPLTHDPITDSSFVLELDIGDIGGLRRSMSSDNLAGSQHEAVDALPAASGASSHQAVQQDAGGVQAPVIDVPSDSDLEPDTAALARAQDDTQVAMDLSALEGTAAAYDTDSECSHSYYEGESEPGEDPHADSLASDRGAMLDSGGKRTSSHPACYGPKPKRLRVSANYLPGPRRPSEMTSPAVVRTYVKQMHGDEDLKRVVQEKAGINIRVRTHFSGSGAVEQVLGDVRRALTAIDPAFAAEGTPLFTIDACIDRDPLCQTVLSLHKDGPEKPRCGFSDYLKMVPPSVLADAMATTSRWNKELEQLRKKLEKKELSKSDYNTTAKIMMNDCLDEVLALMEGADLKFDMPSECFIHRDSCPLDPATAPMKDPSLGMGRVCRGLSPPTFLVDFLGNPCPCWASLGPHTGWFGSDTVSFIICCMLIKCRQPHLIIEECTPGFPATVLAKIFPTYSWHVSKYGPTDLGIPASGTRQWCVGLREGSTASVGFGDLDFQRFFFRSLQAKGDVFFQAPEADLIAYLEAAMSRRREQGRDMRGVHDGYFKATDTVDSIWDQFLGHSEYANLQLCKLAIDNPKNAIKDVIITNLANRPSMVSTFQEDMPRFMRNSTMFLLKSPSIGSSRETQVNRQLIPLEWWSAMGWPVWCESEANSLSTALSILSASQTSQLVGNSMHLAPLGVSILWWFAFVSVPRPSRLVAEPELRAPAPDIV